MRVGLNQDTEGVKVTEWNNIAGDNTPSGSDDACDTDPNSLGCCQTKTISDPSDPCCTYEEIKNNNPQCLKHEIIEVERHVIPNYCHDTGCSNISLSVYYSVRGIEQGRRLSYSYTSNTYKNGK